MNTDFYSVVRVGELYYATKNNKALGDCPAFETEEAAFEECRIMWRCNPGSQLLRGASARDVL